MAHGKQEQSSKPEFYKQVAIWLGGVGAVALVACLVAYAVAFHRHQIGDSLAWGTFGDFVGGIAGTAIALVTLIALALTLRLQATELDATRALLRQQAATLHRQAVEATFFQMLALFDKTSLTIFARNADNRNVFDRVISHFEHSLRETGYPNNQERANYVRAYEQAYQSKQAPLAPYFRAFYHVISFIDRADLTDDEKATYTSIARARLGQNELVLQFINAAFGHEGQVGMRPLIERYGLLKHAKSVPFPPFLEGMKHAIFDERAFMSRDERLAAQRRAAS